VFLGIEIGGTKLQLALGAGDGTLAGQWRGGVDVAAGAPGILQRIEDAVPELLAQAGVRRADLRGVGVGFGGPVDDATQTVIKSHQVTGWDNFPLVEWVRERLGLPAALGNDADVAGLGEALLGAGKGLSPIFYVTIGSGIGGGLIIDGEIYRGCGRGAAEIGHLRTWYWSRGFVDCGPQVMPLENYASGWAIGQQVQEMAMEFPQDASHLLQYAGGKPIQITGQHIRAAAEQGDRAVRAVLEKVWSLLAEDICHVIALLCPRRIVIGGGVSLMGEEVLFKPLRQKVAERVFKPFADCYDIVPAALGEAVVLHGALALARRRFGG
jgi:glucokinase